MSVSTPPTCPLGLTPDDLSAWRDQALAPADERRIAAHTSACPACQRIIAAHNALATTLHAEQAPAPDPRNWSKLQARISGERSGASIAPVRPRAQRPGVWAGLSAVAAVVLLSLLFFDLFGRQALQQGRAGGHKTSHNISVPPLATVAPTNPVAGPRLTWQSHQAPASVVPPPGNQTYDNGFAFAPTDAQTAYICTTTNALNAPITVWATHDGAATWTHIGDLPYLGDVAQCIVTVDAQDSMRLILSVSAQNPTTLTAGYSNAISDDGGKTWRMLGGDAYFTGLATTHGMSVAIEAPANFVMLPNQAPQYPHIAISHDDWRTWTVIDGPLAARQYTVERVWQRPSDGAILAETIQIPAREAATPTGLTNPTTSIQPSVLWQSTDLGAHWTPVPTPPNLSANLGFDVAEPHGDLPWRICGFESVGSGATQTGVIGCTMDGGLTWSARPLPALKQVCMPSVAGCLQQQKMGDGESALLSDGSLITTFFAGPTDPSTVQNLSMYHIFRLPAGSDHWQDLGSQPANALIFVDSAPAGTVVSYAGSGNVDGLGGSIVGQLGGDIPNRGVISFATLP
ncbi:MAG TPA: hypothetical protein VF812_17380 [Ktedonobacterales bacterium]